MVVRGHPKPKRIKLKRGSKKYKDLQKRVLQRDGHICQQCFTHTNAPPHHINKVSQGGDDVESNMVTLCIQCHDQYPNWKERV